MSASIVEKAAVKSDQWTEDDKNAEVIKTLHERSSPLPSSLASLATSTLTSSTNFQSTSRPRPTSLPPPLKPTTASTRLGSSPDPSRALPSLLLPGVTWN